MTIKMAEISLALQNKRKRSQYNDQEPDIDGLSRDSIHASDDRESDNTYQTASSDNSVDFYYVSVCFQDDQETETECKNSGVPLVSVVNQDGAATISNSINTSNFAHLDSNKDLPRIGTSQEAQLSTNIEEQQSTSKPLRDLSVATRQFLDLLDLATGRRSISSYSFLKDRISSLMKNAARKKWAGSHGPRFTGLGVSNIVHNVENRSKKPAPPELLRRERFIARRGVVCVADVKTHAGKWQQEVSRDKFINIPKPSLAEELRSQINSIFKAPLKLANKQSKKIGFDKDLGTHKKRKTENMHDSNIKSDHSLAVEARLPYTAENLVQEPIAPTARLIVTSSCDEADDHGFHFDEMEIFNKFKEEEVVEEIDLPYDDYVIEEKETEESKLEYDLLDEDTADVDFSVSSINEVLAAQLENSLAEVDSTIQYFLEEECVMLSPYSNEAKLYKLLFPGHKIPVQNVQVKEIGEFACEESVENFVSDPVILQKCKETIIDAADTNETVTIEDTIPVLTSPYTDNTWLSDSEKDEDSKRLEEIIREPVIPKQEPEISKPESLPEPESEPEALPEVQPLPEPEPMLEVTPLIPELVPEPEQVPSPVKKVKRKKPEKKKKVYDRNFVKAVQSNHLDVIQQLLYDGANPDTSCNIGTVLHQAAQLGFSYAVQTLLWGGADTEIRNELGDTALHLAAIAGHNDIVLMLTAHGCDVDAGNNYDITPLHMALAYGKLSVIQTLVRMNADIHSPDRIGDTPVILAKQLGYPKEALDSASAEVAAVQEVPIPLRLVQAVEDCSLERVQETLAIYASPDTLVPLALHWPGHSTVLHRAAHLGLKDIVSALLRAGANINARDNVGNTPLHTAVQDGHDVVVEALIAGGADINAATQSGVTPLHRAAAKGHQTTMLLLLKGGANASCKDHQSRTPLEWAKQKGYVALARSLATYEG